MSSKTKFPRLDWLMRMIQILHPLLCSTLRGNGFSLLISSAKSQKRGKQKGNAPLTLGDTIHISCNTTNSTKSFGV
ncbi:MAG: hypothetical protein QOK72_11285 [Nitrososphaeraceae archaeon]|jgi:hypothetical protein|nr:hypothetical protein [Nitrososphaeraceae archaeon]